MSISSWSNQIKKSGSDLHYHLVGLNCRYSHSCPALFYVRNELLRFLPESRVSLVQLTINDPYYDTLLKVTGSRADALFFSVYIWNASYISRLLADLALVRPDLPVVLGGPQAPSISNLPENCTVVEGEIEGVEQEFYSDLKKGVLKPSYTAQSGKSFQAPYTDEDLSIELRHRQVYYESSRGCPFKCSYCLSSVSRGVRHKDLDAVKEELQGILKHQPKIIKFVDRTFNDNAERALMLWQYLAASPGTTRFHFEVAPDRFNEDMLTFLETVPTDSFQFEIGIQSTCEKTLEAINRRMDVEAAVENIRRLAGFDNIHLHVDLIIGLPFETQKSFRESFNRVFALKAHYIQMGLLKILPGTPMSMEKDQFGLVFCEQPPYQVLANRWLDHQALSELYAFGECVEDFYNNRYFRSLWDYIRLTREDPYRFFKDLLSVSRREQYVGLSPTQELLTRILSEMAEGREDERIIKELLKYDWLRCGHRFLPDVLGGIPLTELRDKMWHKLPQEMEGLYTQRERSRFFKHVVFFELSGEVMKLTGLDHEGRSGVVCFLPQLTEGVIRHCQTVVVEFV